jgi:hypothetical protein
MHCCSRIWILYNFTYLYVHLIAVSATTHIQLREAHDEHLHYKHPLQLADTPWGCLLSFV